MYEFEEQIYHQDFDNWNIKFSIRLLSQSHINFNNKQYEQVA